MIFVVLAVILYVPCCVSAFVLFRAAWLCEMDIDTEDAVLLVAMSALGPLSLAVAFLTFMWSFGGSRIRAKKRTVWKMPEK